MEYKIHPDAFASVFAVPSVLVDRHIKLAGAAQLKVLLWLLRNNGADYTTQDIAKALGLSVGDVGDAFLYWIEAGIVIRGGALPEQTTETSSPRTAAAPQPETLAKPPGKAPVFPQKPTREEVAQRGSESPEIAFMLNEAQVKFGRLLNQNETSTLVWLHDHEGLPVPIILMVIEYALTQERRSFGYIEKTALSWAEKDINTIAKAETQIKQIMAEKKAWRLLESVFGLEHRRPSEKEKNLARRWVDEWSMSRSVLRAAYDECVNHTSKLSLPYIGKILEKWHASGVKNTRDLQNYLEKEKQPKENSSESSASYNLADIESMILNDSINSKGSA